MSTNGTWPILGVARECWRSAWQRPAPGWSLLHFYFFDFSHVTCIDIDPDAIAQCSANAVETDVADQMDLLLADVTALPSMLHNGDDRRVFDTVVMNPPFGTKNNAGD